MSNKNFNQALKDGLEEFKKTLYYQKVGKLFVCQNSHLVQKLTSFAQKIKEGSIKDYSYSLTSSEKNIKIK